MFHRVHEVEMYMAAKYHSRRYIQYIHVHCQSILMRHASRPGYENKQSEESESEKGKFIRVEIHSKVKNR